MSYVLVKVVGEEDNNGYKTEFFRVAKKLESLLINPEKNTRIVLEKESFWIQEIDQHLPHKIVYLFEYNWIHYHKYWGDKKEFEKIWSKLIKEGWKALRKGKKYPKRV